MRVFAYLAAAVLASVSAPASAGLVEYGVAFDTTFFSTDPRVGPLPDSILHPPGGSFTFDTDTNQLLTFSANFGFPPTYPMPGEPYNPSPSPLVVALFNAAGPCDLECFIGAVNDGTWSTFSYGQVNLTFGAPLNGSVTGVFPGQNFRPFSVGGDLRVTGPIPEPSTWAMMLMGFGAIGYSMRRRKRTASTLQIA